MADFAPYQEIGFAFAKLFDALSVNWTKHDIDYIAELVRHCEYGEAFENLVAIGQQKGIAFTSGQTSMIADIAVRLEVPNPVLKSQIGIMKRAS